MARFGLFILAIVLLGGCSKIKPPDVESPKKVEAPQKAAQATGLSVDPATIQPGKKFKVRFSQLPGNQQDWITVVASKASDETYGEWCYLNGEKEGEREFTAPEDPSAYEIRLYYDWPAGGYKVQKRLPLTAKAGATAEAVKDPPSSKATAEKPEFGFPKKVPVVPRTPTAVPESYEINGKTFTNDTLLSATPQTPAITLDVKDQPVEKVLEELAKQAGHEIKWSGFSDKPKNITLAAKNAPLWAVLASLCEQGGWGFSVYSQPGRPIGVPGGFSTPIRGYQVNGPVLLTWHGLVESDEFDFSKSPPQSVKATRMIVDLMMDPNSSVEVQEPVLNPDFTFVLADGAVVTLKADKELQDGRGGRQWKFEPKEQLAGKTATLETAMTVWAPTNSKSNTVAWKNAETNQVDGVSLTLSSAHEPDAEKKVKASFTLGYDQAILETDRKELAELQTKIQSEQREASPEEIKKLNMLQGGGRVLSVTSVELLGKDDSKLRGRVTSSMGSPWTGYNCDAIFEATDGFVPAGLIVNWSGANQPVQLHFKLENVPLTRE